MYMLKQGTVNLLETGVIWIFLDKGDIWTTSLKYKESANPEPN